MDTIVKKEIEEVETELEEVDDDMQDNYEYKDLEWGTTLEASDDLIGRKTKLTSGCGSLHLQGWFDSVTGRLMEIYLSKGSSGGCLSFLNGLSRMTSLALRTGADFDYVIDQLQSSPACPSYVGRKQTKKDCSKGSSCPSAVGYALIEMLKEVRAEILEDEEDEEEYDYTIVESIPSSEYKYNLKLSISEHEYIEKNGDIAFAKKYQKCPICSERLVNQESCSSCLSCGWSKCG